MLLSISTFFQHYIVHPLSPELSRHEKISATVCSVVVGALTLGIAQLICFGLEKRRVAAFSDEQKEQDSLKKIISVADSALQQSNFLHEIVQLSVNGAPPQQKALLQLIDRHNAIFPAIPSKAGSVAVRFLKGPLRVIFDETGRLTISPQDRKVTVPVEKMYLGKPVTLEQLQAIRSVYAETIGSPTYNNMAICLEFMKFFRIAKEKNTHLTLQQAFQIFTPNPSAIVAKYHSGDCVALAGALQQDLKKRGIVSGVFGEYSFPDWARPPVPHAASFIWPDYDAATEKVHHCATVVRFTDTQRKDKCLVLQTFGPTPIEELEWSSFRKKHSTSAESPDNILNLEHIIKMQFSGKSKVVVLKKAPQASMIFGIDFLRGSLFINSAGAQGLEQLPCDRNGRFSISLHDLQRPDETATYYFDHHPRIMTHREAVLHFAAIAKDRFDLPDDFTENLLTLAQNIDALFNSILLSPIATARHVLKHTDAAQAAMKQAQAMADMIKAAADKPMTPDAQIVTQQITALFTQALAAFKQMEEEILHDNPQKAQAMSEVVQSLFGQMKELYIKLTADPFCQ